MKKRVLYILLFLIPAILAGEEFKVFVDKNPVMSGEEFQLTLEFSGAGSLPRLQLPELKGMRIVGGPRRSSNTSISNGRVTSTNSLVYSLICTQEGTYTIPAMSVKINNKDFVSEPLDLKVTGQQSKQGKMSESDMLYVKASANKTRAYPNEQIIITYDIYTLLQINNIDSENPKTTGLWVEDADLPQSLPTRQEIHKGVRYTVATFKQLLAFPTQPGKITIPPIVVGVQVRQKGKSSISDFFNDDFFGFGNVVEKKLLSDEIVLDILPFPEEGRPANFNGAVGDYKMQVHTSSTEATTDDAITLQIEITGRGNIRTLNPPELKIPADFDTYPPDEKSNIKKGAFIEGEKKWDYILVPRVAGEHKIPPVEFTYFNTVKKEFITLSSDPINLSITQGKKSIAGSTAGLSKQEISVLGEDIRYIRQNTGKIIFIGERLYKKSWFWILWAALAILTGAASIGVGQLQKRDKALLLRRKAGSTAQKRLKKARALKDENNDGFFAELSSSLLNYFKLKLRLSGADLNSEEILKQLENHGLQTETVAKVKKVLDECDAARYSAGTTASESRENLYADAVKIIGEVEKNVHK